MILWWNLLILSFLRYRDRSVQFVKLSVFCEFVFPAGSITVCLIACLWKILLSRTSSTSDDKALRSLGTDERWQFKISNQSMLKLEIQKWNFLLKLQKTEESVFQHLSANCQVVPSIWHKTEKHIWKHLKHWTDGERQQTTTSKQLKCMIYEGKLCIWHTSYLSRTPRINSCNFFLAGVNFFRFNAKIWQFTVYFAEITQKIGNLLCILP